MVDVSQCTETRMQTPASYDRPFCAIRSHSPPITPSAVKCRLPGPRGFCLVRRYARLVVIVVTEVAIILVRQVNMQLGSLYVLQNLLPYLIPTELMEANV
jgi:hypothetical protein